MRRPKEVQCLSPQRTKRLPSPRRVDGGDDVAEPTRSVGHRDGEVAATIEHVHRNVITVAAQQDVRPRVVEAKLTDHHPVEEARQAWPAEADRAGRRIEGEAKTSLQQREGRRTRTGLRRAEIGRASSRERVCQYV